MFLIATAEISMECETQESEAGYATFWIYAKLNHTSSVGIG